MTTERAGLREAAQYVVQLGNQPGFDDDEWEEAITRLEAALATPDEPGLATERAGLPRTEAGLAMWHRGSNNWSGSGWVETFAANIRAIEDEAALATPDEPVAGLDRRADVAILLAMRGLDGPPRDDWTGWERGFRAALDELLAAARLREDAGWTPVDPAEDTYDKSDGLDVERANASRNCAGAPRDQGGFGNCGCLCHDVAARLREDAG